ncbi:MAG: hypothetical protein J5932_04970 [Prevotella sp.]|nr:hypothetical protein [Prevotella sp.]
MNQNCLAGALAIVAGIMVLYRSYKYYKAKKNIIVQTLIITIGICILISGCIGIYKNTLDGVNILLVGIVACWFMKKNKISNDGLSSIKHYQAWFAAIFFVIAGIIRMLEDLHILE